MFDLIDKKKVRADDYISYFLVFSYIMLILFYKLEWIMSIIVYPFTALFFYGIISFIKGVNKRNRGDRKNAIRVIFGIGSVLFSFLFLVFILTQINVSNQNILNLFAFPILIVGFAGIIKGKMIKKYSIGYRVLNIIVGVFTMLICLFIIISSYFFTQDFFTIYLISLFILTLVNVLCRAALYLSEFGLSLIHLRNFRLFFYIISDYLVFVNQDGNLILNKITNKQPDDDEPMKILKEGFKTKVLKRMFKNYDR
jgi:hypothetical protein